MYFSEHEQEEAEKIGALLKRYLNNRHEAARALGMSRTTLWPKMKKHRLMVQ